MSSTQRYRRNVEDADGDVESDRRPAFCSTLCRYLLLVTPYLTQCLLLGVVTPKILIAVVLVQLAIFAVFLVEKLAEIREHVCSLVAFIIQEIILHAVLLVYAVIFTTKFGGYVFMKVAGFVSFSLVILSIVFRLIYIYKRKQKKKSRCPNGRPGTSSTAGCRTEMQRECRFTTARQPAANPDYGKTTGVTPAPSAPPARSPDEVVREILSEAHQGDQGAGTAQREPPPAYTEVDENPYRGPQKE